MKRTFLALSWGCVFATVASAYDLRRPPSAADRAQALVAGLAASRDSLETALVNGYQPGGPSRPGSTGVTSYRAWLLLWKWCELFSRTEKSEAEKLLKRSLRFSPEAQRETLLAPGQAPESSGQPLSQDELQGIVSDEHMAERLLRHLVPEPFTRPRDRPLADSLQPQIVAEWINDDELSRSLFQNLSDFDYAPALLASLQEIRLAEPLKFKEYRALAVALSLVYDQKLPSYWPHGQVDPKLVPIRKASVSEHFRFWVQSNESKGLLLDLRKLTPGELKFVVDAPLETTEFQWARKNVRYSRTEFAKTFQSVTYAFARMQKQQFHWVSEPYTLENIRRLDGICVDQAYYAMISGKAKGLPTLFFAGQGADGGHAWFGYLRAERRWELDCGRYQNQNYAVGEALDPQTWLPITDHQLELLAQSFRDRLEFAASEDDIRLAFLIEQRGDPARTLKAYDSAIQVCPQNAAAWQAKAAYLKRSGAPSRTLQTHHEAALRQFAGNRDIRVSQQSALSELARLDGDTQRAELLEKQIVLENKRRRADLSVGMAARQIATLIEARDFEKAISEYRRQLTSLGKTGGGTLFYEIVEPVVEAFVAAGDRAQAKQAIEMARKALDPASGSIIDNELAGLSKEIDRATSDGR